MGLAHREWPLRNSGVITAPENLPHEERGDGRPPVPRPWLHPTRAPRLRDQKALQRGRGCPAWAAALPPGIPDPGLPRLISFDVCYVEMGKRRLREQPSVELGLGLTE